MDRVRVSVDQIASGEISAWFRSRSPALALAAACALVTAVLLLDSRPVAFGWDEGFHLLAPQSIASGKIPSLDFCFPQPPLDAYLNAELIQLSGADWHVIHLFAAIFAAA